MNYTTAVFLINSDVRAIVCSYEPDEDRVKNNRYTFKTLDKTIQKDDLVVVPTNTRHGMTVVKVVEVDVDPDFDSDVQLTWIVAKVDQAAYAMTLSQEAAAVTVIKSAEKTKKRNELRNAMLADSAEALKALPITVMSTPELTANA